MCVTKNNTTLLYFPSGLLCVWARITLDNTVCDGVGLHTLCENTTNEHTIFTSQVRHIPSVKGPAWWRAYNVTTPQYFTRLLERGNMATYAEEKFTHFADPLREAIYSNFDAGKWKEGGIPHGRSDGVLRLKLRQWSTFLTSLHTTYIMPRLCSATRNIAIGSFQVGESQPKVARNLNVR